MPHAAAPHHPPISPPQGVEGLHLEPACCCVCDSDDVEPLAVGEDFEYGTSADTFLAVRCTGCGLVYLRLRPAASDLPRVYPPHYHAFDFSPARYGMAYKVRRRLEARRLLRFCRGLPVDARILDVGCGDGFHLKILREFGSPTWTLEGADTSERAVSAARQAGLRVHHGTIQSLLGAREPYDMALLIATIEHVFDPREVLSAVRELLKPGGRVVVVTDNAASWSFHLFKKRHWGGYHFPRHLYLFDPETIRRLGKRVGLEVECIGTMMSPVNWVYSVRNTLVDWSGPTWLVERFSLAAPVSLGAFTVFGSLQQLMGRGELLQAVLRRSDLA